MNRCNINIGCGKDYFKNKNILITGITGFIGSRLKTRLELLGSTVYGISRSTSSKNIFRVNITDFIDTEKIFKEKKIDICYHLASEALVESGQHAPYDTFNVNILGTLNILEIARKNNLEKLIIASTSHVYGNSMPPFRENSQLKQSRPYETSKICADLIAQSYIDTFHLPVLIPRFVNTYGPGDKHLDRLIPKTINSILCNQAPTMWGKGNIIRAYLYIDDVINGYLYLAGLDMGKIGQDRIFNFCSNDIISIKNLILKIIDISGKNIKIQNIEGGRSHEATAQYASWSKAKRLLGWQPKVSLEEGLKKTIKWYEKNLKYIE